MPGYMIHIAVAKEYSQKHKKEITNRQEFLEGTIAPDLEANRNKSHYERLDKSGMNLNKYLEERGENLISDFEKGYFLHLITDEIFYYNEFKEETKQCNKIQEGFYHDYDCLNKEMVKHYEIKEVPEKAKKYMKVIEDGIPKFLQKDKIYNFIDTISKIKIQEQIQSINETGRPKFKGEVKE